MDEITNILLNGMELPFFFAMLICEFAGIVAFFTIEVIKSLKYNSTTPTKFSFKIMFKMSALRFLLAIIIIPFTIVYYPDVMRFILQTDIELQINAFSALIMGISIDRIIDGFIGGSKEGLTYLKSKT